MTHNPTLTLEDLSALCQRAFPDRPRQNLVEAQAIHSRQHEMIAFELWWTPDKGIMKHEKLMVRRYVSPISWWRPDDNGKAQREATVCRWLKGQGIPAPAVYAREFTPQGDIVLFERLPSIDLGIGERPLGEAVGPYITPAARLLADLHRLDPSAEVKQVVPHVTLASAVANLAAISHQIEQPDLAGYINRVMQRMYDVVEQPPVLLHGDFHFLNILVDEEGISGLVDWEFTAIGDPRWDVANVYMQLVDFGAAEAADHFLNAYLESSGRNFEGPPLYNVVAPLQQWAISEWLVRRYDTEELGKFALAHDLADQRDVHRRRAELAMKWLE